MDNPDVSVIMPCLNEEAFIGPALESLVDDWVRQKCEFLIIDGGSRDGTRRSAEEFIRKSGVSACILDNPRRLQSFGLNLGIKEARGQFIVRIDAHCLYPPGYIQNCTRLLTAKEADGVANVGGAMMPVGIRPVQKAIALALRHPFGVGDAKFHLGTSEGYVDTVYLGTFRKSLFDEIGIYDAHSHPNEDAELNLRLLKAGKKIYFNPSFKISYFPRESFRALARQYFRYGQGRAYTTWKQRAMTSWRQVGPVVLAVFLIACATLGFFSPPFWLLLLPYPILITAVALFRPVWHRPSPKEALEPAPAWGLRFPLALAFMMMHVSWGIGFISASIRRLLSPRRSPA